LEQVEGAIAVRVSTLEDLVRLASTLASRLIVMPIYRFKEDGQVYYFIQASYKDYYKQYGLPVLYYFSRSEDDDVDDSKAKYVIAKADEMGEKVEITDKVRPGFTAIPIVNLAERPPFFKR
jgi:hypothetical protein